MSQSKRQLSTDLTRATRGKALLLIQYLVRQEQPRAILVPYPAALIELAARGGLGM
jgi:hypothetical protein